VCANPIKYKIIVNKMNTGNANLTIIQFKINWTASEEILEKILCIAGTAFNLKQSDKKKK